MKEYFVYQNSQQIFKQRFYFHTNAFEARELKRTEKPPTITRSKNSDKQISFSLEAGLNREKCCTARDTENRIKFL